MPFEAHEVRGFGLFLKDLVARLQPDCSTATQKGLAQLVDSCINTAACERPGFSAVCARLEAMQQPAHNHVCVPGYPDAR